MFDTAYPANHFMPPHAHDAPAVSLVVSGGVCEWALGVEHVVGPLSVVIKPAGLRHANRFGPQGARILCVNLSPSGPIGRFARGPEHYEWITAGPRVRRVFEFFRDTQVDGIVAARRDDAEFELRECLDETTATPPRHPPRWLADVVAALHASKVTPPSTTMLASQAGVHPVYLARVFRRSQGCSLRAYVRRLRVQAAAARLAARPGPLLDLALDLGFSDQAHFCRCFKHETGLTPEQFRRMLGRSSKPQV